MTKRNILEITTKIFGLYCLISFFRAVPMLGMTFITKEAEFITNKTLYILFTTLYPLLFFFLAYFFLRKSQLLVKLLAPNDTESSAQTAETQPAYATLSFWVIIIGIYYFVSSASAIVSQSITLVITHPGMIWSKKPLFSQVLILALSLVFIFRSNEIENLIRSKSKQSTQPEAEADVGEPHSRAR